MNGVSQQACGHHQHKGEGFHTRQRGQAFQRAVDLAIAELQPGKAGQHPAAQKLAKLPQRRRRQRQAPERRARPDAVKHAGKQRRVERQPGGQQNHQEDVDRPGHAAKGGDTDVDPVYAAAEQAEAPGKTDSGGLAAAPIQRQQLQAAQRQQRGGPEIIGGEGKGTEGTR